jgi:BASS family bile acid:Na+ symporter
MLDIDTIKIHFSPQGLLALNIVLAIIMFGIALELRREDFVALIQNRKSATVGLAAHFILLPLLTFILTLILHPVPSVALGMILVGCCPGGNMSNMFTHFAKGNTALAVGLTSVSHLLAVVIMPINFAFYGGLHPGTSALLRTIHLSFSDVFETIFLIVVIPLVTGMLISRYQPVIAANLNRWMKGFSLVAFALFIVVAFAGNARAFVQSAPVIMPLVAVHNAVALGTGFLFAKVLRLPFNDIKTITFETGVQNSGLGLVLIFTFFNGMGGMALVAATWGVWHLVTGGLLSWWWSKDFTTSPINQIST